MQTAKQYLTLRDLEQILPFKKSKIQSLIKANVLPVTKIGRDYITTSVLLDKWITENIGKEIYY